VALTKGGHWRVCARAPKPVKMFSDEMNQRALLTGASARRHGPQKRATRDCGHGTAACTPATDTGRSTEEQEDAT